MYRIEAYGEVSYMYGDSIEDIKSKLSLFAPLDIKFNVNDYKIEECSNVSY